jgi:hypothetical protein
MLKPKGAEAARLGITSERIEQVICGFAIMIESHFCGIRSYNQSQLGRLTSSAVCIGLFFCVGLATPRAHAQDAYVSAAWWTYQQDCNGNGCHAGNLPGDKARLNWSPVVTDCYGSLAVFEIVYSSTCGSGAWVPVYTNSPHTILACRSLNNQYVDLPMGSNCLCRDYKIALYEVGQTIPEDIHSSTNDPNLAHHQEELLSQDTSFQHQRPEPGSPPGRAALPGYLQQRFLRHVRLAKRCFRLPCR